jgi:hypothetical protein
MDNKPLFDNIKPYDYLSVANKLHKYYKDTKVDIFNNLVNIAKKTEKKPIIIPTITESLLISYYASCRTEAKLTIFSNVINSNTLNIILGEDRKVYSIKPLRLKYHDAFSLFYQLHLLRDDFKTFNELKIFVDNLFKIRNELYLIAVVYEGTDLKCTCRFSYTSKNFKEMIENTKFIMNDNSINNLSKIFVKNYFNPKFAECFNYLKTLKKYIDDNILPIDRPRIMIYSSAILFIFGIRPCQDLDVYINWIPIKGENKNFSNKLIKLVSNNSNKLDFIDMAFKGQGEWVKGGKKEYLDEWFLVDWPNLFGAKNMQEVVFDPRFYFEFMGLKFLTLDGDIARRKCRSRPASYADLVAINYYLKLKVDIPPLPLEYYKVSGSGKKEKLDTLKKMIDFYKNIQYKLLNRFGLKYSIDRLIELIQPNSALEKMLK